MFLEHLNLYLKFKPNGSFTERWERLSSSHHVMCNLTLASILPALNKITVGFGENYLLDGQGPSGQNTNGDKSFSFRDFVWFGTDGGCQDWYGPDNSSSCISQSKEVKSFHASLGLCMECDVIKSK